jgi:hypothetical protein
MGTVDAALTGPKRASQPADFSKRKSVRVNRPDSRRRAFQGSAQPQRSEEVTFNEASR